MQQLETLSVLDERLDDDYSFSITRSEEQDIIERLEDLGYLGE